MKSEPGPSDMLEELADKVIVQMNRQAVTSFQTAYEEMTEFHKFLIDAYATKDETGKDFSFAQMGDWSALHREWIRQYRRLFENAVEYIGRENDFIHTMVYVPLKLLPSNARHTAPEILTGLLDLSNILVHRLEAWVTKKRHYSLAPIKEAPLANQLAGSDKQAYEDAIMHFVGAWESTLSASSHIYGWRSKELESEDRWRRYSESWSFLQKHLQNTAYMLCVAVWNEDEIGADYYCEMLLRWYSQLRYQVDGGNELPRKLLFPDLAYEDWNVAQDTLKRTIGENYWGEPNPSMVFSALLQNALNDTIFITAGVVLAWFVEGRQGTDISPRIASRLLSGKFLDAGMHENLHPEGFQPHFLTLVRMMVSGGRFERDGYASSLDKLVEVLDSMTERRVVSGRVYTPSTKHGREDLRISWLACLLALMPPEGDENFIVSISQLCEQEDAFAEGDATLRGLLFDLRQAKETLVPENRELLQRAAKAINPDILVKGRMERLAAIFEGVINTIEEQRKTRLQSRPVDEGKLNAVRERVEKALTSGQGIEVFSGFDIELTSEELPSKTHSISGIGKGSLTVPEMEQMASNQWEVVAHYIQNYAAHVIWSEFAERPRRKIEVQGETTYIEAIEREAARLIQEGQQPVLLVQGWSKPSWISKWFGWRAELPEGLVARRKDDIQSGHYVGTVNEIDVYRADLVHPNQSLMFPADLLRAVKYGTDENDRAVDIKFSEEPAEEPGKLIFHFSQKTVWAEDEVVTIEYQDIAEGEATA